MKRIAGGETTATSIEMLSGSSKVLIESGTSRLNGVGGSRTVSKIESGLQ